MSRLSVLTWAERTPREWVGLIEAREAQAEVSRLQAQSVPQGLSPAQACEFLTRGRFVGMQAKARVSQDEALLASEAGARSCQGAKVPRSFRAPFALAA